MKRKYNMKHKHEYWAAMSVDLMNNYKKLKWYQLYQKELTLNLANKCMNKAYE